MKIELDALHPANLPCRPIRPLLTLCPPRALRLPPATPNYCSPDACPALLVSQFAHVRHQAPLSD